MIALPCPSLTKLVCHRGCWDLTDVILASEDAKVASDDFIER